MSALARAAGASASQSPAARITATAGAARAATTQQSSTSSQTEDCSQYDLAIQQLEQALLESHAQIEDLIGQLEMLSSGQGDAASLIADLQSKLQTAQLENTELRVQSSTNAAENASSTAASGNSKLPWIVAGSAAAIALGLGVKVFMAK
jgi:small-conductance mechanosensitive channel